MNHVHELIASIGYYILSLLLFYYHRYYFGIIIIIFILKQKIELPIANHC